MARPDPPPDSRLAAAFRPSPNHGERTNGRRPDMVLLHYTGMRDGPSALARLCDPASEVSCHYVVEEDGRIVQLVREDRRAWHAGVGAWAGERDVNSCSIGIEIVHPGHAGGLPPYPPGQIQAVIGLAADIVRRRAVPPARVIGHSDVAPDRKEDPGEVFPWAALHAAGLGRWTQPRPIRPGPALTPGTRGAAVASLQARLAGLGYALARTGAYDSATEAVVRAFQRHYRPERIDGVADPSTLATLDALIAS